MERDREKWERFRESKLEAMRLHKYNVERRMRYDCNTDKRYWSQRQDKLKRYPKQEALDPSWYTDNIYSNQSVDEEDDFREFRGGRRMRRGYDRRDYNGNSDMDRFTFIPIKPTTPTRYGEFKYPKSSSYSFGVSSYEKANPRALVPKSHSFSVTQSSPKIHRDVRNGYPPDDFHFRRRNYSYGEGGSFPSSYTRICDRDGCVNESCLAKESNMMSVRNDLHRPDESEEDDLPLSMWRFKRYAKDRALAAKQPRSRRFYYGEDLSHNDDSSVYEDAQLDCNEDRSTRTRSSFVDEMEQLICCDRPKNRKRLSLYDDDSVFQISDYRYGATKTKSMLEVKPPNKYDDTSSDSTDIELDDFNFDFEKYWEELDKSPSPQEEDFQFKNSNIIGRPKVKNSNAERYNNGSLIDECIPSAEELLLYEPPPPILKTPSASLDPPQPEGYINNLAYNEAYGADFYQPMTPVHKMSQFTHKVYPELHPAHHKYTNFYPQEAFVQSPPPSNAISLINNIFSIYKPNKYSPLNCHTQQIKPEPCKKILMPSTIRPLGEHGFLTSVKRPLLVKPMPSQEQAQFKIIPEKTGLRISPLYRFDFGSGSKKKMKLKSTARPLLFPH
ncbi:uncharacterized protein LOC132264351 [Phlebotomus argentipes]|uniref:uncharacterized protein LOC132264351 n=1 Tax=Phlebotomus argentipes TaxID=94469 RepID=UPI002892F0ED|nr:uncharacterized protein LOC132264351 [Phlebotomus argentipes]